MFTKLLADDVNFPKSLKCAKLVTKIYLAGNYTAADENALAVIGSRKASKYGKDVVRDLVGPLVKQGITIVSGLADGIDSEAQELALQLGGRTLGVLGYGFSYIKDDPQYELMKQIIHSGQGAVISPFNHFQRPTKLTFINRNKLIAGLAKGVLVVEASQKSGTFYTVEAALDQEKPVYAVPGSIYSYLSRGTHQLIREGAGIVEKSQDLTIF